MASAEAPRVTSSTGDPDYGSNLPVNVVSRDLRVKAAGRSLTVVEKIGPTPEPSDNSLVNDYSSRFPVTVSEKELR